MKKINITVAPDSRIPKAATIHSTYIFFKTLFYTVLGFSPI